MVTPALASQGMHPPGRSSTGAPCVNRPRAETPVTTAVATIKGNRVRRFDGFIRIESYCRQSTAVKPLADVRQIAQCQYLGEHWSLSNPDLAPHLEFVDLGGHGYANVRLSADEMRTDAVPAIVQNSSRTCLAKREGWVLGRSLRSRALRAGVCIRQKSLAYRMLLLNAGQRPMQMKLQSRSI